MCFPIQFVHLIKTVSNVVTRKQSHISKRTTCRDIIHAKYRRRIVFFFLFIFNNSKKMSRHSESLHHQFLVLSTKMVIILIN
uniref:Uncharacterized protein n=1 Tax=Arundo donax TaxID=35708 RepID=A0A0A9BPS4_ARUDO